MADFILTATTDSGTVNFPKTDRFTVPAGVTSVQLVSGSEWNSLCQAVVDTRKNILSGSVFGFGVRYANAGSVPTIPGHSKVTGEFLWVSNVGQLTLHRRDNTDYQVITQDVFNRIGLNVLAASGTVHVYNDGTDARMMILQQANVSLRNNTVEFFREVTGHKVFVGQFQNASDGVVPANAFILNVNDGTTTRNVMHADVNGTRVSFGHSTSSPTLRVGIGTISPTKKLDVTGDLRVSQSASFDASAYVTGALFVEGAHRVIGSSRVLGPSVFSGTAGANSTVVISGSLSSSFANALIVIGGTEVSGTLKVTGSLDVKGYGVFNNELFVTGYSSFTGLITSLDNHKFDSIDPNSNTAFTNTVTSKNIPKAWCTLTTDGAGNVVVSDGFNVKNPAITDAGGGLQIEFAANFDNALFGVTMGINYSGASAVVYENAKDVNGYKVRAVSLTGVPSISSISFSSSALTVYLAFYGAN